MFDEEPDGDPHGECAAEIHRLEAQRDELLAALKLAEPYVVAALATVGGMAEYEAERAVQSALARAESASQPADARADSPTTKS